MSLAELLPSVRSLPRGDKFRLVQELIKELAHEEGLSEGEYPAWSPYDAHEAAATLMQLLEAQNITEEKILFQDAFPIHLACPRGVFRKILPDNASLFAHQHEPAGEWERYTMILRHEIR